MCAVFLYNICCFHKFVETNMLIEIRWITVIHYKNVWTVEVVIYIYIYIYAYTPKNYFQHGGVENCDFSEVNHVCIWFCILGTNYLGKSAKLAPRYSLLLSLNMASDCHVECKTSTVHQLTLLGMEIHICIPNLVKIEWLVSEIWR